MSNDYPKMLYKTPGTIEVNGGFVDALIVANETVHAEALSEGWHDTVPEAMGASEPEPEPLPMPVQLTKPAKPTKKAW